MRVPLLPRRGLLVAVLAGLAWPDRAMALSATSYMVFFNSGRSDISPQGGNTLRAFARDASNFGTEADVVVSGHTDSAEASDDLSFARAMAVRDRLIELGVPADGIAVSVYADRRPLVPTGPNTREPQNRRVEIVLTHRQRGR